MSTEHVGSDEKMKEIFRQANHKYDFFLTPNATELGITNKDQAAENIAVLMERGATSYDQGFYIEHISLKLQFLEFFLRMFWVKRNGAGSMYAPTDRRMFGQIVKDCEDLGFDPTLIAEIRDFNEQRINAIHKYFLGETSEAGLKAASDTHKQLGAKVQAYVLNEIGHKITNENEIPGDIGSILFQIKK